MGAFQPLEVREMRRNQNWKLEKRSWEIGRLRVSTEAKRGKCFKENGIVNCSHMLLRDQVKSKRCFEC